MAVVSLIWLVRVCNVLSYAICYAMRSVSRLACTRVRLR